jgi:dipeptidyl aminopeptidase/acylaminoacyl peptidase
LARLEVEELLEIESAREARLSPDAGRLAFCAISVGPDGAERSEIRLLSLDREESLAALVGASPRWSPDGRTLAYLAAEGERRELRLFDIEGGSMRVLAMLGQPDSPTWSGDGQALALACTEGPDRPSRIAIVALRGGEPRLLDSEPGAADTLPSWSPDGRLVFAREWPGDSAGGPTSELRIAERGAADSTAVATDLAFATAPSWSPDGASLGCVGTRERRLGSSDPALRLWVVPTAGGAAREVAGETTAVVLSPVPEGPVWSADGSRLSFREARRGEIRVVAAELAMGVTTALTEGGQVLDFSLEPRTGVLAWTALAPRDPGSVRVRRGGATRTVEASRGAWTRRRGTAIPGPDRRRFRSPRGAELDGWLQGLDHARSPQPTLLALHGGPHGFFGPGFQLGHFYRNVLAAHGWLILTLNATGSGSYGEQFADAIRGGWADRDLPEQLAALAELIDAGLADQRRLAVAGYSYGGYLAAWAAARDGRFRAAVVGAPITDLVSFQHTSDIGEWYTPWQMRGGLPDNAERYQQLSPVNAAGSVTAPVLLLHGDADRRVPIGQGEMLRERLEAAGARVEMVRYEGADHLFYSSGRPDQRLDFNQRIVAWLRTHTEGGTRSDG